MGDHFGEFGARDPFPAEIESAFAEKVLGNVDTEHKILIPTVSALSLSQQECTPISPLQDPMSKDDAQKLLKKVNLEFPYGFFAPLFSFKDVVCYMQHVV
jgi:4a-hydroxytetrahydrobiopterin dehydratase